MLLQLSQCSKCSLKLFKFRCILESSSTSMKYLSRERIRRGFGKLSSTPATASSSSNDAPLVGITGLGCPSAQWDCRLPLGFKDRGNSSRLRYCYALSNNWFYFCGVHSIWKGLCQEKHLGQIKTFLMIFKHCEGRFSCNGLRPNIKANSSLLKPSCRSSRKIDLLLEK